MRSTGNYWETANSETPSSYTFFSFSKVFKHAKGIAFKFIALNLLYVHNNSDTRNKTLAKLGFTLNKHLDD